MTCQPKTLKTWRLWSLLFKNQNYLFKFLKKTEPQDISLQLQSISSSTDKLLGTSYLFNALCLYADADIIGCNFSLTVLKQILSTCQTTKILNSFNRMRILPSTFQRYSVCKRNCVLFRRSFCNFNITVFSMLITSCFMALIYKLCLLNKLN